jgi:hypothetical protein
MARAPSTELTAELVRDLLDYDEHTGALTWKVRRRGRIPKDSTAGNVNAATGYRIVAINTRRYKAHRIIWLMMTGVFPEHQIDHRDGNPSNNRWQNLREATHAQNQRNRKLSRTNTSGYTGVYRASPRRTLAWSADIRVNGRKLFLGCFPSKDAAHAARVAAELEHFGEFRRTL